MTPPKSQNSPNMSPPEIKIFGDSLIKNLKSFKIQTGQLVSVHGYGGFKIEQLVNELASLPNKKFDIFVLIGTNNLFKHRVDDNQEPEDDSFTETVSLLSKFLDLVNFLSEHFAEHRCFILPIVPRSVSSVTNKHITLVNGQIKGILKQFDELKINVKFCEISYEDFLNSSFSIKPELYFSDKLHLNEFGVMVLQTLIEKFINRKYSTEKPEEQPERTSQVQAHISSAVENRSLVKTPSLNSLSPVRSLPDKRRESVRKSRSRSRSGSRSRRSRSKSRDLVRPGFRTPEKTEKKARSPSPERKMKLRSRSRSITPRLRSRSSSRDLQNKAKFRAKERGFRRDKNFSPSPSRNSSPEPESNKLPIRYSSFKSRMNSRYENSDARNLKRLRSRSVESERLDKRSVSPVRARNFSHRQKSDRTRDYRSRSRSRRRSRTRSRSKEEGYEQKRSENSDTQFEKYENIPSRDRDEIYGYSMDKSHKNELWNYDSDDDLIDGFVPCKYDRPERLVFKVKE